MTLAFIHDDGQCDHGRDHDRSLPDGTGYDVEVWDKGHQSAAGRFVTVDSFAEAQAFAAEHSGTVSRGGQNVADDGLLGCNDCGARLYYCANSGWYHHVDPDQECFLSGSEAHNYYAEVTA